MISAFKKIISLMAIVVALFFADTMAQDTVYVRKHVTDTIYVNSPPDTVYIKKAKKKPDDARIEKNEYVIYYDTDTIPPAVNFYIDMCNGANLITLALGLGLVDFEIEQENRYRGSIIYDVSAMIQFHDIWEEWEGIKSIASLGLGYRHYLVTSVTTHANPSKKRVVHRNVPLNSISFFVQAMAGPSLSYDDITNDSGRKKGTFGMGVFTKGALGCVMNMGNFLWKFELGGGYQYWGDRASVLLGIPGYAIVNGSSQRGPFFSSNVKLGF